MRHICDLHKQEGETDTSHEGKEKKGKEKGKNKEKKEKSSSRSHVKKSKKHKRSRSRSVRTKKCFPAMVLTFRYPQIRRRRNDLTDMESVDIQQVPVDHLLLLRVIVKQRKRSTRK